MKRIKLTSLTIRVYSVTAERKNNNCVKTYDEIPGPRGLYGCGNIFNYLPIIGKYTWSQLHKANQDKYNKYGSIVKETMLPGTDIVWLYDPKDIAIVLNDNEQPWRQSHLALEKYRQDRPNYYNGGGLLPTNGTEWWRLRSELQKSISTPKAVRSFLPDVDGVIKEFLNGLPTNITIDILPQLLRLNLELICLITFGVRMNAFNDEEQSFNSITSKLIRSAEETNSLIMRTDQGLRLWRYFNTPHYKKLSKAQEFMQNMAIKLIEQKLCANKISQHSALLSRCCLIEEYNENPKLDFHDILGTACDFLLAGTDTTSYTTAFALYYLSKYPDIQNQLYSECQNVIPNGNDSIPLDKNILDNKIPYTRAVLKEVFRLNPISVGVGRILQRDIILGNYQVPRGTVVVTQNMIACRLECNFLNALEFKPARWLNQPRNSINPYLVLPFGHGTRACIARRLAEQNILILLLRLVQRYEIIWRGDDIEMDVETVLINKPNQPIKVELIERMHFKNTNT